jgi:hypothetical protein
VQDPLHPLEPAHQVVVGRVIGKAPARRIVAAVVLAVAAPYARLVE